MFLFLLDVSQFISGDISLVDALENTVVEVVDNLVTGHVDR